MTAAKQSKKGPSAASGERKAARGKRTHQRRAGVRAATTMKTNATDPFSNARRSKAGRRKKPRVTPQKSLARRTVSHSVGEQVVDYLRTTLERLTEMRLARELRRDALRLYQSLRSQEKQVARTLRLQIRRWQNAPSPVRAMQPVRNALQRFDVRRLPVAGHR